MKTRGFHGREFVPDSFRGRLQKAGYGNELLVLEIGQMAETESGPPALFATICGFDFGSLPRCTSEKDGNDSDPRKTATCEDAHIDHAVREDLSGGDTLDAGEPDNRLES